MNGTSSKAKGMKLIMYKHKHPYSEKVVKDNRTKHLDKSTIWIIEVTILAFTLSLVLSFFSDIVMSSATTLVSIIVLVVFIGLGILFDMVGVSVTVADAKVFNSMAAKKIRGSKTALKMIKNNARVSSFCNDVVGDICGILSGGAGVTIAVSISSLTNINPVITNFIVTSLIAALTIGGKALGKSFAINKANKILYSFSKTLDIVTFKK